MIYKFFDKRAVGNGLSHIMSPSQPLAEELHKPITRNFEKRKVHSPFIDHVFGGDPADVQLLSKCNKGIRYLLRAMDIFSKYAWVVPVKDKRG